ncbi:hypothetical protein C8R44DRAFT_895937 [Mycena epipterygia]|nr:hypothetical protein C8R44DRAFT_895937 [Mycena epipterygia]
MSSPNPYPPQNNASFPALHLYPLDDSFIPKRIALGAGQRVKIARPPNTKTQPGERNGYFDSRVLSRQHAEVWEESNKIFIKDVKSSNGTFINGERLSLEGRESEPYELKSDDILEFGVDIVSEDNKTVLHRKVVARVTCVFPNKTGHQPLQPDQFATMSQTGATFNGIAPQRRPQIPMIHQGLAGLGGMGGGVRTPGRGLTLDHIFSRLQAELAKSRDTGHDLQVLTGALNNIEDTLNGALPPTSLPQFPDVLPGVMPPPPPPPRTVSVPSLPTQAPMVETPQAEAVAELQAQLREHQEALAAHMEGIRALEGVLAEQEAMKREVRELREFVGVDRPAEEAKREGEDDVDEELEGEEGDDDDSDTRSVMTVTPHELDSVAEEDEEEMRENAREGEENRDTAPSAQEDADALQEQQEREDNFTRERAQTPEPSLNMLDPSPPRSPSALTEAAAEAQEISYAESPAALSLSELTARLAQLASQLESALAASSALQAQHASAQATIATLEAKLARLEAQTPEVSPPAPPVPVQSAHSAELEEMQTQLVTMREELALERGHREAWAGMVEARIRLVTANGQAGKPRRGRLAYDHGPRKSRSTSAGSSGSRSPSPSPSSGLREERGLELELDLKPPKTELLALAALSPALPATVDSEKFLRADAAMVHMNVQTAIGVLILGIAAAAVLWRVKPE